MFPGVKREREFEGEERPFKEQKSEGFKIPRGLQDQMDRGGLESLGKLRLYEAKYFNAACNPFFEGSGVLGEPVGTEYNNPRIPDKFCMDTVAVTLRMSADMDFDVETAKKVVFKLVLPGPVKEYIIPGTQDAKIDAGAVAVQVVSYDQNDQPCSAKVLTWDNIDMFRDMDGNAYRVVGGGVKIYANKYGDNAQGGQIFGGFVDEDILPLPASQSSTYPPTDPAVLKTMCPVYKDIKEQMGFQEYSLSPAPGQKDGITMRIRHDNDSWLNFLHPACMADELQRQRSDMPTAVATAIPAGTGVRVQAVLHLEIRCNHNNYQGREASPRCDPIWRFDQLFSAVNSQDVQPYIVSGHSFKNWLKDATKKVKVGVGNGIGLAKDGLEMASAAKSLMMPF